MQLEFLGESFDANDCNEMCDNCQKHYQISTQDVTSEAKKILAMVNDFASRRSSASVNQYVEILRGFTPSSVYFDKILAQKYNKHIKMSSCDIKRTILAMLQIGILKEVFEVIGPH